MESELALDNFGATARRAQRGVSALNANARGGRMLDSRERMKPARVSDEAAVLREEKVGEETVVRRGRCYQPWRLFFARRRRSARTRAVMALTTGTMRGTRQGEYVSSPQIRRGYGRGRRL